MGDVHGAYKALMQCLEKSKFDKEYDQLIVLGDICDGYDEVYEVVEELMTIKNLVYIIGNHDLWFIKWMESGIHPDGWRQGGFGTMKSYCKHLNKFYTPKNGAHITTMEPDDIPQSHKDFFNKGKYYHVDAHNNVFVHGGFNRHVPISEQSRNILMWDRDLFSAALSYEAMSRNPMNTAVFKNKDGFNEICIGHTCTQCWENDYPMKAANVYNLDTGAGWQGKLSIMDIDTKQIWQSELNSINYPNQQGR